MSRLVGREISAISASRGVRKWPPTVDGRLLTSRLFSCTGQGGDLLSDVLQGLVRWQEDDHRSR
jgi:hypothetical protein